MTHKTTITDSYILITSDEEEINEEGEICWNGYYNKIMNCDKISKYGYCKKIIAHLPLNNAPKLEGAPLLPPLPNVEDDVEKMKKEYLQKVKEEIKDESQHIRIGILGGSDFGFMAGYDKAKEKYKYTEDDVRTAIEVAKNFCFKDLESKNFKTTNLIIQSLSQPKMPIGFKCEVGVCPRWLAEECEKYGCCGFPEREYIKDGVMQGEWVF